MQISKQSWHYRFLKWNGVQNLPMSLCPYFWTVTWSLFVWLLLATLVGLVLGVIGIVTYQQPKVTAIVFVAIVCWATIIFYLREILEFFSCVAFGILKLVVASPKKLADLTHTNFVLAYLKAVKDKVCPMIEYID